MILRLPLVLALVLPLEVCRQEMGDMPRYEPLEASEVFPDGMSARTPPPGTVARDADLSEVPQRIPYPVTMALLERGRERYEIFCAPCHSRSGNGDGMIVERGFPEPPSYFEEALRLASDRHFYDVITEGYGVMYSYAARVQPRDRWAIVAYIRALQYANHAPTEDLPAELRARLGEARP